MKKILLLSVLLFMSVASAQEITCSSCTDCNSRIYNSNGNSLVLTEDFKIDTADTCISLDSAEDLTIDCKNRIIELNGDFLDIRDGKGLKIKDCKLFDAQGATISVLGGEGISIEHLEVRAGDATSGDATFLDINGAKDIEISNSKFSGFNSRIINVDNGDNVLIKKDIFKNNEARNLIDIHATNTRMQRNALIKNKVKNGHLILLEENYATFENNSILDNKAINQEPNSYSNSLVVFSSNDSKIIGNSFMGNKGMGALAAFASNNLIVQKNVFNWNTRGIYLLSMPRHGTKTKVIDNNFTYNNVSIDVTGLDGGRVDAAENRWDSDDCRQIWKNIKYRLPNIFISPIITRDGKHVECKRESILEFEFDQASNKLYVRLSDDRTGGIPDQKVIIHIGDKELPLKTGAGGTASISISGEPELIKNIGSAKAVFEGTDFYYKSESGVEISGAENECKLIYGSGGENKLDIVFLIPYDSIQGYRLSSDSDNSLSIMLEDKIIFDIIDKDKNSFGFSTIEPFKSNMDKINFYVFWEYEEPKMGGKFSDWLFDRGYGYIDVAANAKIPLEGYLDFVNRYPNCRADRVILLLNKKFRSCVDSWGWERIKRKFGMKNIWQYAFISCPGETWDCNPRMVIHEMGHLMGLRDEYVEEKVGDFPGYPNCASSVSQANDWWASFIWDGSGVTAVDPNWQPGCSYTNDNYRATEGGVMNNELEVGLSEWEHGYGPVDEWWISKMLEGYS